jgi:hypothetical protein
MSICDSTQFPPKCQTSLPAGVTTYRFKHPRRGWIPLALSYWPERRNQPAAYQVLGTNTAFTPEQVRAGLASQVLIPTTRSEYSILRDIRDLLNHTYA